MSQSALGQKQVTLLLAVAAVLLAAVIGILVWQNSNSSPTASVAPVSTDPVAQAPTGMGAQVPEVEFDPATAPAVPEGQTPLEYLTGYYEACAAKEYETAYGLLPVASQQYYGDAASFEQTLEGYGISDFSVDEPVEGGDTVSIVGWQVAQGMTFGYEWTFVKADDGTWRVKSRTMAGAQ
ncbi:MAG: hypothetical protein RQ731_03175 [Anaerosomatales bacterium]|nr:hypothetical protein [Anaerosomatales bacterium]MDT8433744.1 hypothetical protein [Anaerosomatales bacterium]